MKIWPCQPIQAPLIKLFFVSKQYLFIAFLVSKLSAQSITQSAPFRRSLILLSTLDEYHDYEFTIGIFYRDFVVDYTDGDDLEYMMINTMMM